VAVLRDQGSASVFIRFGTSPTVILATCFNVSVSIAETERSAEFET
jgi:hypothetical protein